MGKTSQTFIKQLTSCLMAFSSSWNWKVNLKPNQNLIYTDCPCRLCKQCVHNLHLFNETLPYLLQRLVNWKLASQQMLENIVQNYQKHSALKFCLRFLSFQVRNWKRGDGKVSPALFRQWKKVLQFGEKMTWLWSSMGKISHLKCNF